MRPYLPLLVVALGVSGCTEKAEKRTKDIGTATADAAADTQTLGDIQGAVNEVVRNATDCEVVKAALPEAQRKMDEGMNKLRTAAARAMVDSYRAQVRTIAQNCP